MKLETVQAPLPMLHRRVWSPIAGSGAQESGRRPQDPVTMARPDLLTGGERREQNRLFPDTALCSLIDSSDWEEFTWIQDNIAELWEELRDGETSTQVQLSLLIKAARDA